MKLTIEIDSQIPNNLPETERRRRLNNLLAHAASAIHNQILSNNNSTSSSLERKGIQEYLLNIKIEE